MRPKQKKRRSNQPIQGSSPHAFLDQAQPASFNRQPIRVVKAYAGSFTTLRLPVTIANRQYKAVIDVGLPTSLISSSLWESIRSPLFPMRENDVTRRVTLRTSLTLMGFTDLQLRVRDTQLDVQDVLVYDFDEPEIYLGIGAISALGLIIDFQEATFGLRCKEGRKVNWTEDTLLFPSDKLGNFSAPQSVHLPVMGVNVPGPVGVKQIVFGNRGHLPQPSPIGPTYSVIQEQVIGPQFRNFGNFAMSQEQVNGPQFSIFGELVNSKKKKKRKRKNPAAVADIISSQDDINQTYSKIQAPPSSNGKQIDSAIQIQNEALSHMSGELASPIKKRRKRKRKKTAAIDDITGSQDNSNQKGNEIQIIPINNSNEIANVVQNRNEELSQSKTALTQLASESKKHNTVKKAIKFSKTAMCVNCYSSKHTIYDCGQPIVKKCIFCNLSGHVRKDCPSAIQVDLQLAKKNSSANIQSDQMDSEFDAVALLSTTDKIEEPISAEQQISAGVTTDNIISQTVTKHVVVPEAPGQQNISASIVNKSSEGDDPQVTKDLLFCSKSQVVEKQVAIPEAPDQKDSSAFAVDTTISGGGETLAKTDISETNITQPQDNVDS